MELPTSEGEAKEAASGNGKDNFFSKRFVKFLGVFLLIIGIVGGGYQIWYHYFSADAKMQANYERYQDRQEQFDAAMKADTYGGKTPQETLSMFIDALKKGDVDLASKYFLFDKNLSVDKWKKFLLDIATKGNLSRFASDLEKYDEAKKTFDPYYVFLYYNNDGTVGLQINMQLNSGAHIWKIESL